jgi:hypothetical protein
MTIYLLADDLNPRINMCEQDINQFVDKYVEKARLIVKSLNSKETIPWAEVARKHKLDE